VADGSGRVVEIDRERVLGAVDAEDAASTLAVLHEGWALGSIGAAANLLLTYLILLAALRFVGASGPEISAVDAFAAFAIAFWAGAVLPITGSGLGVVDATLIAVLVDLSSADDDVLVAAALVWRVFYSVIALPLGALTLSHFHKANPGVLRRGTAEDSRYLSPGRGRAPEANVSIAAPSAPLTIEPAKIPTFALSCKVDPSNASPVMNSETVKPIPPSAAAPQAARRPTPAGNTPIRARTPPKIDPLMPTSLPTTSATAIAHARRLVAASASLPPPRYTPALARAKSGTAASAESG
jgi:hypothetical protein